MSERSRNEIEASLARSARLIKSAHMLVLAHAARHDAVPAWTAQEREALSLLAEALRPFADSQPGDAA